MVELYRRFSDYLKEKYGTKVYKISLTQGFTCPNRDGTKGTEGCIYCGEEGAFDPAREIKPVSEQLKEGKKAIGEKYGAEKFIAYFQAFTNTYGPLKILKKNIEIVLRDEDIVATSIGTRPDCLSEDVTALLGNYSDRTDLWVELGLQSASIKTLKRINRKHSVEDFGRGVEKMKSIDAALCVHIILGLPGEIKRDICKTADFLADMEIDALKIHPLHILKDTVLAEMYENGEFSPPGKEEYVDWTIAVLERIPGDVVIQRLTGGRSRDLMVAPEWCLNKHAVINAIEEEMIERDSYQGKRV